MCTFKINDRLYSIPPDSISRGSFNCLYSFLFFTKEIRLLHPLITRNHRPHQVNRPRITMIYLTKRVQSKCAYPNLLFHNSFENVKQFLFRPHFPISRRTESPDAVVLVVTPRSGCWSLADTNVQVCFLYRDSKRECRANKGPDKSPGISEGRLILHD